MKRVLLFPVLAAFKAKLTRLNCSETASFALKLKLFRWRQIKAWTQWLCALTQLFAGGSWKLNTSLLDEQQYRDQEISFWTDWLNTIINNAPHWVWWDAGKFKLSITYAIKKKHISRKYEKKIEKLRNTKRIPWAGKAMQHFHNIKSKLEQIELEKAQGIIIQAQAESGENATKYFLNHAKKKPSDNTIQGIKSVDGTVVTDKTGLLSEHLKCYKELYTKDRQKNLLKMLVLQVLKKNSQEAKQSCEGLITLKQCEDAISKFQSNKSPGIDGLPIDFQGKFATHGLPETIVSDNGSNFTSGEFEEFPGNNGMKHISGTLPPCIQWTSRKWKEVVSRRNCHFSSCDIG